jgi:HD-GYP domain-containing protein (c-di-GMP phosphodiesterase class II)
MAHIAGPTTSLRPPHGSKRGPDIERLLALQAFNARLVCMTVDETSYQEVVNGVWKVMGCDFCALFLNGGPHGSLQMVATAGYEGLEPNLSISLSDSSSMHVQAYTEEYLVHVDDLSDRFGIKPLSADLRSSLVMPIIANSGPVGVFDFGSRHAGAFTAGEISMCSMLVDQMSYSLENIRLVNELSRSRDAVIRGMALLAEIRDSHIGGHLNRICAYSRYLAEQLLDRPGYAEVTSSYVDTIARAAALHDVGKVGIPDAILLKPGSLTQEEFAVMKSHTTMGADLLSGLMQEYGKYAMIAMGVEVAIAHHERWDGGGYPLGRSGCDIPLSARILTICDVFDALTSRRVYKDAWSHDDTIANIRGNSGKQFDPFLVEIFLARPADLIKIQAQYPD